jgi:hypothetical protein
MTSFVRALFGILPGWRPLRDQSLPLWHFVRRRACLPRLEALRAELRCRGCDARALCASRIARGCAKPPARCPNARLFAHR